jgi:hypothetical protein
VQFCCPSVGTAIRVDTSDFSINVGLYVHFALPTLAPLFAVPPSLPPLCPPFLLKDLRKKANQKRELSGFFPFSSIPSVAGCCQMMSGSRENNFQLTSHCYFLFSKQRELTTTTHARPSHRHRHCTYSVRQTPTSRNISLQMETTTPPNKASSADPIHNSSPLF